MSSVSWFLNKTYVLMPFFGNSNIYTSCILPFSCSVFLSILGIIFLFLINQFRFQQGFYFPGSWVFPLFTSLLSYQYTLIFSLSSLSCGSALSRAVLKSMGLLHPEPHGWAFISDQGKRLGSCPEGHFTLPVSTLLNIYRFSARSHMLLCADQLADSCLDILGLSTQSSQLRQALGSLSRREETTAGFTDLSSHCFLSLRTPGPLLFGVHCFCVFVSGRYLLQLSLQLKMSLNL